MNVQRLTRCGLFAAMALIIHILESYIPPLISIPGIKIGFSNIITLAAVYIMGPADAFAILITRIVLGGFFAGQIMSLIYSLCGGVLCYCVTVLLRGFFRGNTIWVLGILGAIAHNVGQILCAYAMFRSASLVYYGVVLCAFSFVTGSFTGLCAQYMVKRFEGRLK